MDNQDEKSKVEAQLWLASERTLLAWIRTGLAMMGFGFVVARFGLFLREVAITEKMPADTSVHLSVWMGTILVVIGVFVFIMSAVDHASYSRRLQRGEAGPMPRRNLGVLIGLALASLGIAMVSYLVLLAVGS